MKVDQAKTAALNTPQAWSWFGGHGTSETPA